MASSLTWRLEQANKFALPWIQKAMHLLYLSFSVFLQEVSFGQQLGLGVLGIIIRVLWHFNFHFFWPVSFYLPSLHVPTGK